MTYLESHTLRFGLMRALAAMCLLVLALLLAWLGVGAYVDWRGPTAEQQHALALVDLPDAPEQGADGFAALWLLGKEVPIDQQADWLARDVAWLARQAMPAPIQYTDDARPIGGLPSASLPNLKLDTTDKQICNLAPGCLSQVRADLAATQAWVNQQATILDRVQSLQQYSSMRNPFYRIDAPPSQLGLLMLPYTRFALQFAQNEGSRRSASQYEAMQAMCQYSGVVQRWFTQPDQGLIPQMIAAAHVRVSGQLLADMLAERAPNDPQPTECAQVFAPDPQAPDAKCRLMQGEWQRIEANLLDPPQWIALYPKVVRRMTAQQYAPYCESGYAQAFERGERSALVVPEQAMSKLDCLAGFPHCLPSYPADWSSYADRLHDREATRRAMAGLLWLRAQPAATSLASREALWSQRPAELRWPGADAQWVWLNAEHTQAVLRVPLWFTERGPHLDLAL